MILDNLKFKCPNDDCDDIVCYKDMHKHLLKKCSVKPYKKVEMPEGVMSNNAKPETNRIPTIEIGLLPTMFLEEGEAIEKGYEI